MTVSRSAAISARSTGHRQPRSSARSSSTPGRCVGGGVVRRHRFLSIREFDEHLSVTALWCTPGFASEQCNKRCRSRSYVYDYHILCARPYSVHDRNAGLAAPVVPSPSARSLAVEKPCESTSRRRLSQRDLRSGKNDYTSARVLHLVIRVVFFSSARRPVTLRHSLWKLRRQTGGSGTRLCENSISFSRNAVRSTNFCVYSFSVRPHASKIMVRIHRAEFSHSLRHQRTLSLGLRSVSFWSRSAGGARSMLGQHRDDDIARVSQDGF
jgi:hypothetical protein